MGKIIKSESLHLQAYQLIKESIMQGDLNPGERVVEAKIASKLGTSRGTVREAIRMLTQDGLLIYNDGFVRVYEPTVDDIADIFQCRESLEVLAIRLAIKNLTDEVKLNLDNNLKETKNVKPDSPELGQLDQQFHTIITKASNNGQLIKLLEVIKVKIHYMRKSMVGGAFYPSFIDEHEQIYEAILNENEEDAVHLMSAHIKKALEGVLKHIKS
ncbi:GntR family transcriptional regulator [Oceanobacillus oncorhynchi subsp. incaldanensis]|uniref:GntR family transcriptional regulator n=1 Tax=Oceanobacillus aidingensis TaxID=645964 RepID=A0ABV9K1C8_9BACI|nr:GntR family transcriptional regulator [Oceanobacillus oncorhynchi]MDM8101761.1 GntR family transcriptional regulator [Oceanobacillus oncorhynchi]GIO20453.1 GntR family transcriptional regulator [Oceanobacillus oncorhynchi subsp. incaldanensis]